MRYGVYTRKDIGAIGEHCASQFLKKYGYRVMEGNHRRPWGEIDIIAERGGVVRFVEVKSVSCVTLPDVSRETNGYRPEELVHPRKLRKIVRTAEIYMNEVKDQREFQIDVVAVFLDVQRRIARCRLFEQVL